MEGNTGDVTADMSLSILRKGAEILVTFGLGHESLHSAGYVTGLS